MATFGYTTVGATTVGGASPAGSKFTAPDSGTITKLWFYVHEFGSATRTAVYADSAGAPGAKLAESSEVNVPNATWGEFPISLAITNGTVYWLMHWNADTKYDAGAVDQSAYQSGQTYPTWPDPFVANADRPDVVYSIYAEYTPSGGATGQPTTKRFGGVPHMGTQKFRGGHRGGPWGRTRDGLYIPQHLTRKVA